MKVFLLIALSILAVAAHDVNKGVFSGEGDDVYASGAFQGRATRPAADKPYAWDPDSPACNYIVDGEYSAFTPRETVYMEYDTKDGAKSPGDAYMNTFCEHCAGTSNPAYQCGTPQSEAQLLLWQLGINPANPKNFETFGTMCAHQQGGFFPLPEMDVSGVVVARHAWLFTQQQDKTFYSCTDLNIRNDKGSISSLSALTALILANIFWLAPLALLPVVAAAIYARRHKRESIRLSRMSQMSGIGDSRMTMMSGMTAKTAAKYQSGFTDNMSGGRMTMMSGKTDGPATKYQSGFTAMSASTDAPAQGYKSGFTAMSGQTAEASPGYKSGYTGGSSQSGGSY